MSTCEPYTAHLVDRFVRFDTRLIFSQWTMYLQHRSEVIKYVALDAPII